MSTSVSLGKGVLWFGNTATIETIIEFASTRTQPETGSPSLNNALSTESLQAVSDMGIWILDDLEDSDILALHSLCNDAISQVPHSLPTWQPKDHQRFVRDAQLFVEAMQRRLLASNASE